MAFFVYIATNIRNTVFYIGITNDIKRRIYEHSHGLVEGFTKRYNICKLVWYEEFPTPEEALIIEKKIKGWTRKKKIDLIKNINPDLTDLLLP